MSPVRGEDPTTRFTDRVDTYVRARPGYPAEVVDLLRAKAGLGRGAVVADLGAGTGIFTRLLLDTGATVHAVEPNAAMRTALADALGGRPGLHLHARPAEATGLPTAGVDLVTAAQAFHWFDRGPVTAELRRVLRPGGTVALVWNGRRATTPFGAAYEALLDRWALDDVPRVDHTAITPEDIAAIFAPGPVELHTFPHHQVLDLAGLRDRLLSSSYVPLAGHPDHRPMLAELTEIVARYGESGIVRLEYRTEVHLGRFA